MLLHYLTNRYNFLSGFALWYYWREYHLIFGPKLLNNVRYRFDLFELDLIL